MTAARESAAHRPGTGFNTLGWLRFLPEPKIADHGEILKTVPLPLAPPLEVVP